MYARHFFKMLLGLVFMAFIGLAMLVLVNHYSEKDADATASASPTVPSSSAK